MRKDLQYKRNTALLKSLEGSEYSRRLIPTRIILQILFFFFCVFFSFKWHFKIPEKNIFSFRHGFPPIGFTKIKNKEKKGTKVVCSVGSAEKLQWTNK